MKIETYPKFIKGIFVGLQSQRKRSSETHRTPILKSLRLENDGRAVHNRDYEYSDYMPWMNQI